MNWNSANNPPVNGSKQVDVLLDNPAWATPMMGMWNGLHSEWSFYNAEEDFFYGIDLSPKLMPTHYMIIDRCEKIKEES